MPRKLRIAKTRIAELSETASWYLTDGLFAEPESVDHWELFGLEHPVDNHAAAREPWEQHRHEILETWIRERPGTRPALWWEFDSPEKCRRRLGGIGTAAHEVLNYVPSFEYGIPSRWVDAWAVSYYNGRAKDIHGNRIGEQYHEGHFKGVSPDPSNPPLFESQAAYLKRHGLLAPEEGRRLKPRDFEPEIVEIEDDDKEE